MLNLTAIHTACTNPNTLYSRGKYLLPSFLSWVAVVIHNSTRITSISQRISERIESPVDRILRNTNTDYQNVYENEIKIKYDGSSRNFK